MKYTVPVTRTIMDVYEVDARNGTEAAVKVGMAMAAGDPPSTTKELSRKVGGARTLVNDQLPEGGQE